MELAVGLAFVAAFGFGSGQIFVRLATQRMASGAVTFLSVGTAAAFSIFLALVWDLGGFKELTLVTLGWFAVLGILNHPMGRLLTFTAVSLIGATRSSPVSSTTPIFAVALAAIFLGERPHPLAILGTLMVVSGLVFVMTQGNVSRSGSTGLRSRRLGYTFAVGAALSFAVANVIARHVVTEVASPWMSSAFGHLLGFLFLGVLTHRQSIPQVRSPQLTVMLLCAGAGICNAVAVVGLFNALERAPVTLVMPIYATAPLVTLTLAQVFLRHLERINSSVIAGTVFTVTGVILVVAKPVS